MSGKYQTFSRRYGPLVCAEFMASRNGHPLAHPPMHRGSEECAQPSCGGYLGTRSHAGDSTLRWLACNHVRAETIPPQGQ